MSARGKVVVVTGGNTGIGFETVKELNLKEAKVYMLCRAEQRALDAKAKLVEMGCDPSRLLFEQCDLTNFESVRNCADRLQEAEPQIDILINNAGIMFYPDFEKTVDGHEMHWQSNYLGHFLLTELLLPAIKAAPSARMVILSSKLHLKSGPLDTATIDDKKSFGFLAPYNRSKLANVMHARDLARRLQKEGVTNVTVNSCHPGVVATELGRDHLMGKTPFKQIGGPIRRLLSKTPSQGAQTSLHLALSEKVEGVSGKYFADCAMQKENPLALDDKACEDLYNYSMKVCGLRL